MAKYQQTSKHALGIDRISHRYANSPTGEGGSGVVRQETQRSIGRRDASTLGTRRLVAVHVTARNNTLLEFAATLEIVP